MSNLPQSQTSISQKHPVAYFCAEYGLDVRLPIYAGGLGVLAGDTIKQAADDELPMVGIGLLYRGFGMVQELTQEGLQVEKNFEYDPLSSGLEHVYVDDKPLFVKVHLTTTDVWLRCWKKTLSDKVTLYLLDANTDQNKVEERSTTEILYYGSDEMQLKQQLVLGIGGVKLLRALGINPSIYHLNEGRPAFFIWQLIRELMDVHSLDYQSAFRLAKQQAVYTNHTLVGAGNVSYPTSLLSGYAKYYSDKMGISKDTLLAPGLNPENAEEFSITLFALHCSRKANGVSTMHSELCQQNWPEFRWTNVTNGVHLPTWQDHTFQAPISADELWQAHQGNKSRLEQFVKARTGFGYDPSQLVIGWARRLAGYKQLPTLFEDIERLRRILKNNDRPVQLLLAGKAHQGDEHGKQMLKEVIGHLQRELAGQALFIPNYDLEVASMMTLGCDVWLNTPQVGREACGTSGMKAISNGVLSCSTPDGWVTEVNWDKAGWLLDPNHLSPSLYSLLENTIVPLYYERNQNGLPQDWIGKMQSSIDIAQKYSAQRMLEEYQEQLYKQS